MKIEESEEQVESLMKYYNGRYRAGDSVIPDQTYDALMVEYQKLFPHNDWFNQKEVEPEPELIKGKTVKLPARMLSTNKAYSIKEIEKWANNVVAVGESLGMDESDVMFRVTPKLDGFAAFDDGKRLYTRGDGRSGTDISRAFERGLIVSGDKRGEGPGEIVVEKKHFNEEMSVLWDNTRNVIAGVVKEGELDGEIRTAIAIGAIQFVPFKNLRDWIRTKYGLTSELESIWENNLKYCPFETDGLVIEAISENIKKHMGSTNHHHKWQIAYKKNQEYHDIKVTGLEWQVSKNGRLTPVVQLEPTKVSGVTISKATGHHYGNVVNKGIGGGATVRVCRSGLVIPYISEVIEPAVLVCAPAACPSCGSLTEVDGDNLLCSNTETCPAQIEGRIEFFFKTLGNCDGFGPKVIEQLCNEGISDVSEIYNMPIGVFSEFGFGEKTAFNLFTELTKSISRPIEDWRFLAAFSIHNVGKGGCEKLLQHHRLKDVFSLSYNDIVAIDGFAETTANSLLKSLARIKPQFDALFAMGFNLVETPLLSEKIVTSAIAGLTVVFTGSMQHGKREHMEKEAKLLGAKVSGSVSSKTDYLIVGANVGEAKLQSAVKNGVKVLTEAAYLQLVA